MQSSRFQLRLALVLYGGISLAVYMNGMVQELLALLRAAHARKLAERGEHAGWVEREQAENPYYALLTAAQTDVTVDVIAGTSAGGLNGLLLAKALASGAHDMAELTQLWLQVADIDRLAIAEPEPRAMLSGEFLEAQLLQVLESLSRRRDPALADIVEVLDLFVPATDVRGHRWVRRDEFRQPLEGVAHKYVFQLKKRSALNAGGGYEQNDFMAAAATDVAAQHAKDRLMAKIGRATSAFPGALSPVCITPADAGPAGLEGLEHDLAQTGPGGIWFADGGILSNKPFEPVLKAISHRSSDLPVKRILAYLEPDPAQVEPPVQTEPHILETVAASVLLPMVQDIQESLDQVAAANERNRRLRQMTSALEQPLPANGADADQMTSRSRPPKAYYQSRVESLTAWLQEQLEKALEGLDVPTENQAPAVRAVLESMQPPPDVPFQIRRLRFLIGRTEQRLAADEAAEAREQTKARLTILWSVLDEWRNATWVLARAGRVNLHKQEQRDPAVLAQIDELNQAMQALAGEVRGGGKSAVTMARAAAAVMGFLTAVEKAAGAREAGAAALTAQNVTDYEQVDLYLLPYLGTDPDSNWEQVDLYRLSPNAANQWVTKSPAEKLTGIKAGHFGAFFSQRWRANDLMWGRLDGAELLIRLVEQEAAETGAAQANALAAAAEEALSTRRRQILVASPEAIDLQQIRQLAGIASTAPPAVSPGPQPVPFYPTAQMEQEAAAALMTGDAEASFLMDPKLVPDHVLQQYLQEYQKIGEEGLKALEPRQLETDLTRMLENATKALSRKPAQSESWITFLQKPLLTLFRTANWIAGLLVYPLKKLGGLPLLLALAGCLLLVLQVTGIIALGGWVWVGIGLLLLPEGIQLGLRLVGAIALLLRRSHG